MRASRISAMLLSLSDAGDTKLIPQARLSGPMPWVIAIMVALTVIALAGGLTLRKTVLSAQHELKGGLTVQIVEAREDAREAQSYKAVARLQSLPIVRSVKQVPQGEIDRLIEPWLGSVAGSADAASIPVPSLIDVQLNGEATEQRIAHIKAALRGVAPAARVDAQSGWLEPVFEALESLQWLAIALVLLLALALAAAVLMASRTALGTNRDTIEIVHLLGGTDGQIAKVFQRSIGMDAAGGGLVGLGLAIVVILFLGQRFSNLGAGMVDSGAFGWPDWLLLATVPIIATVLAMVTSRVTVMHALRKML